MNQSNYGRNQGWWIEFDGKILGKLIKPVQIEMFWEEYEIEAEEAKKATLLNQKTT